MSTERTDGGDALGRGPRWAITIGLLLLCLPVSAGFYFFSVVAALGCFADCSDPSPQPLLATALLVGAAGMAGAGAGLVPWAMGRRDRIRRTVLIAAGLVVALFLVSLLDS